MSRKNRQVITAASITLAALLIDQVIKIWVKTNMYMHEVLEITPWFKILFTENRGMAFGMEIVGKLFLTSFRVVAVSLLGYYLYKVVRNRKFPIGYVASIAFVLAGAAGNIVDSLLYGEIFTHSMGRVAELVPFGQGYSSFMYGNVVDMFYFPLFAFDWPAWVPFVGGEHFIFFSPIFNFADACISCSIFAILLFYRKYINQSLN